MPWDRSSIAGLLRAARDFKLGDRADHVPLELDSGGIAATKLRSFFHPAESVAENIGDAFHHLQLGRLADLDRLKTGSIRW